MAGSYPLFTFVGQSTLAPHLHPTGVIIVDISGKLPVILCELDASSGSLKDSYPDVHPDRRPDTVSP